MKIVYVTIVLWHLTCITNIGYTHTWRICDVSW